MLGALPDPPTPPDPPAVSTAPAVSTTGVGVVSPHLDDAALSCAGLLAGRPASSMVTVFAGGPRSVDPLTEWEAVSGCFSRGDDIVGARRHEDRAAAAVLGATPVHLDHWDHQYRTSLYGYRGPTGDAELIRAVTADLATVIAESTHRTWVFPLGLSHPDHRLAAAAALGVIEDEPDREWLIYDELPYAVYLPGAVDAAVAALVSGGWALEPAAGVIPRDPLSDDGTKGRAVRCYHSQVRSLGEATTVALDAPERIRRLVRG